MSMASTLDRFGKFQFLYNWFLISNKNLDVIKMFKSFKTRMDMDVKFFLRIDNQTYKVFEIFNPGINVGLIKREIGNFSREKLNVNTSKSYYESRKNMSGVLIRSTSVIRYPFKTTFEEYMMDLKLRYYDIYSKFHYQQFLLLKQVHEFSYNTTIHLSYFGNTSSGQTGGMGKMLWDDAADMTSCGCIMRLLDSDRIFYYDFIMPFYKFRSYFYFRNPGLVKPNFKEVLKPFSRTTWFATLYTCLIVCCCIEAAYLVEEKNAKEKRKSWFRPIFTVVAAFCQQSLDTIPTQVAGRIILLHLFIMSVLLYNYYTSSLVSSLISTEPEVLKTIKELYESQMEVGIELQSYTITYILERSKVDYYMKLLNGSKIFPHDRLNFLPLEEGIERVHRGGFAYHTESTSAYPLIDHTFEQESICDLAEIGLINSFSSVIVQKRSQYKKLFQVSLRKAWERGLLNKLLKTWVDSKPECLSSARVISVGVNDLFLPYFLLAMGFLASLIILLLEISRDKFQERLRNIRKKLFFKTPYVN
ncbi:ionotropic receptor 75a-like isoform X2 [Sitophilus oryzae]|uniref:Ionotropic receptor 75a-like isoform X2 n=1 Tax=Sitophilus oryzae TaxID=7048 RepID=A0A6J2XEB0_SITOR|nr:ionotropic receptor 75a-like isoform X2 [Sitophilus oryzae]